MLPAIMDTQKTYIEQLLDNLGWTIDKLAREADMSYSQTHEIVTQGFRPGTRLGNIRKLAKCLNVSVVELLDNHLTQK